MRALAEMASLFKCKEENVREMLKKAKGFGIEMSMLSEKIKRRIRELENTTSEDTVIIYRNDSIIKEAVKRLRDLRYNGRKICACYHLPESMHSQFKDEPEIMGQLDLSESLARTRVYLKKGRCVDAKRKQV